MKTFFSKRSKPRPDGRSGQKAAQPPSPGSRQERSVERTSREKNGPLPRRASPQFADDGEERGLSGRHTEEGDTPLLPGIKPVLELLETAPQRVDAVFLRKGRHSKDLDRIADLCRAAGVRFSLLEPPLFARIYSGGSQGVVARLFEAGYAELDDLLAQVMDAPLPLLLALDQVQDPGNAGALARTLYALGGAGMIIPRHNGVYLGAAAAKASAGALSRLAVCKAGNLGQALDKARKQGITIYGAAAGEDGSGGESKYRNPEPIDVFTYIPRLPAMLVLGGEEAGMRSGLEKRCDFILNIPMLREFDSLNVAQAGAIIISSFLRFRLAPAAMPPNAGRRMHDALE